ncbi:MAG: 23S rRNA (guanosine(2251)-2'-O)-methyltransferase RlmB, partial [Prochlorococcaceae cyanobacterium]
PEFGAEPTSGSERFGAAPADDLIWGRHSAQATLESERPIHRIWCTPELRFSPKFLQLLREAKSSGVLVEEVTWARLGQLTGGAVHQGIVLQTAAAETVDLEALIEGCRKLEEPPLLMAVDGLTDPHNLGAIVRSAEALGAHGLVLPQRRSAGLTGSVAKVAAGALEHLPVARVVNLNRSLDTLKQEGYRVIGLAEEGSVSLGEATLDGPLVIVTGSEGDGLSMLTRKHCDQLVRIPLRGATPSLNASVATALLLYEVARRGWMRQITGSAPAPRVVRPLLSTRPSRASAGSADARAELEVSHEGVANEAHSLQVQPGDGDSLEGEAVELNSPATQVLPSATSEAVGEDPELHGRIHSDQPPSDGPDLPTVPAPASLTSSPPVSSPMENHDPDDRGFTTDALPQGAADNVSPGLESAWSAALATEATDPATTAATQSGAVVGEDIRF